MKLDKIWLKEFRNYKSELINFNPFLNIIVGNNAQGKTNILEAIYYLMKGSSFKQIKEEEVINFENANSIIQARFFEKEKDYIIKCEFSVNKKKTISLNNEIISKNKLLKNLFHVVLFTPEDMGIIKEGPNKRRDYFDKIIVNIKYEYKKILVDYNNILIQRNNLLKNYYGSKYFYEQLKSLDTQLIEKGTKIMIYRKKILSYILYFSTKIHGQVSQNNERLAILYKSNININGINVEEIALKYKEELKKSIKIDLERKTTTVGPHKDDFEFFINNLDAKKYSSQGQQKTIVLSLKLGELKLIDRMFKTKPILLLDDVFSELDIKRRQYLINSIEDYQTIITTTENNFKRNNFKYSIISVNNGKIKRY